MINKKKTKTAIYREMLEKLQRNFYGGNYEDYSCGNTMGLWVRNPSTCEKIFERFERIKKNTRQPFKKLLPLNHELFNYAKR